MPDPIDYVSIDAPKFLPKDLYKYFASLLNTAFVAAFSAAFVAAFECRLLPYPLEELVFVNIDLNRHDHVRRQEPFGNDWLTHDVR